MMRRLSAVVCLLCIYSVGSFALTGGVSGGGGNVLSPMPPDQTGDPEMVEDIVKDSVGVLHSYLKSVHQEINTTVSGVNDPRHQVFARLFAQPQNVFAVMEQVRPSVQDSRPCYDRSRNPVDGSVANLHEGRFCISAYLIAQKVHRREIPAQSAALLMHEYSELVGLTEDEAVNLQSHVLQDFKAF